MNVGITLIALLSFCSCIHGQTCSETLDLTDDLSINASLATSCIRCIIAGQFMTDIQWIAQSNMILTDGMNGVSVTSMPGVLVITDADAFFLLGIPVSLQCGGASDSIYPAGLFAPIVSIPDNGVVTEGGDIRLSCISINNRPGTFQRQWYNPVGEPFSTFQIPQLSNVLRDQAGVYTCRLTSLQNGDFLEDSGTLIVNYMPSIASSNPASNMVFITETISLSCISDSVPVSVITWFHEGSLLTNGAGGAIITLAGGSSTLMRSGLTTASGGTYTCVATNVVGSANASVEVIIQVPPSPPTNLMVSNIGETSLDLSWTNGFDGLSPIIGVTVEVFDGILRAKLIPLAGDSSLQSTQLSGLNEFTLFNITVTVNNAVGFSESAMISAVTLSLRLGAPRMVTLTSPTSTTLVAEWLPPVPNVATTSLPEAWFVSLRDSNNIDLCTFIVSEPTTLTYAFTQLGKGSEYIVRVAGNNSRGIGEFSEFVSNQTLVDPPSMPLNLIGEGVSSSGLTVSWLLPTDNGGRPVTQYVMRYRIVGVSTFSEIVLTETSLLLFNGGTPSPPADLVGSNSYEVEVLAVNTAGRGDAAIITIMTQSLNEPQPILVVPVVDLITNRTALISWEFPGGQVDEYLVQYKERLNDWTTPNDIFVRSVAGNVTMVMLTDLIPSASYDVRVASVNAMGTSQFFFQGEFSTQAPSPPTVSGPREVFAGETTQLNCSSSVSNVFTLRWVRVGRLTLPSSATQVGNNLVFTNPLSTDTGTYSCISISTGVSANITISFLTPSTEGPSGGVVNEMVIALSVVGVIGIIVIVLLFVVMLLVCTRRKPSYSNDHQSAARNPAHGMSNDAVRNPDDLSNDAVRNPACDLSDAVRSPAYDLSNDAVRNPAYDLSNDAVRNPAYDLSNDAVRNPAYDLSDAVRNPAYDLSNDAVRNPAYDLSDAVRNPAYDLSNDAVRNPAYDLSNDAVRNPAYDLSVRQAPNDAASVQSNDEDVYEDIPDEVLYETIDPDNSNNDGEGGAVMVSSNAAYGVRL
ncbi:hemicentin-1-like isoform X2 [Halichondria panicea]|uniref:hemicentin-1-like isoform X2 n=1 Tax=Halichondria panicea TaxID=6063 RepID=UPI00312B67F7